MPSARQRILELQAEIELLEPLARAEYEQEAQRKALEEERSNAQAKLAYGQRIGDQPISIDPAALTGDEIAARAAARIAVINGQLEAA
jgi:hypothetical protein